MNWRVLLPVGSFRDPLDWLDSPQSAPLALARQMIQQHGGDLAVIGYGAAQDLSVLQWAREAGASEVFLVRTEAGTEATAIVSALAAQWAEETQVCVMALGTSDTVPWMLGSHLGWAVVPGIRSVMVHDAASVTVRQGRPQGWQAELLVRTPAILLLDPRFFRSLYLTVRQRQHATQAAMEIPEHHLLGLGQPGPVLRPYRKVALKVGGAGAGLDARARLGALSNPQPASAQAKSVVNGSTEEITQAIMKFLLAKDLLP
ncbi:MAG: hypothetical protein C7B46_13100 [Sulfobacillus benefaciens]|uniref:Electron transfer flavoprotein alpha/beta-subunit N-terminal domain-containing protein n=1 Tax=Sulfobacillus benefaciens TaxID=453960 RepID=A0A2T2XE32_9FIRM|nr:MAG: hypothetical protein C7B46_13100 [Sulfobacillus benefaciens]